MSIWLFAAMRHHLRLVTTFILNGGRIPFELSPSAHLTNLYK
jgi:hypothetical protein